MMMDIEKEIVIWSQPAYAIYMARGLVFIQIKRSSKTPIVRFMQACIHVTLRRMNMVQSQAAEDFWGRSHSKTVWM